MDMVKSFLKIFCVGLVFRRAKDLLGKNILKAALYLVSVSARIGVAGFFIYFLSKKFSYFVLMYFIFNLDKNIDLQPYTVLFQITGGALGVLLSALSVVIARRFWAAALACMTVVGAGLFVASGIYVIYSISYMIFIFAICLFNYDSWGKIWLLLTADECNGNYSSDDVFLNFHDIYASPNNISYMDIDNDYTMSIQRQSDVYEMSLGNTESLGTNSWNS